MIKGKPSCAIQINGQTGIIPFVFPRMPQLLGNAKTSENISVIFRLTPVMRYTLIEPALCLVCI